MDMPLLNTAQLARRLHLSERRIRALAKAGRIEGAVRIGSQWAFGGNVEIKPATPGRPQFQRPDAQPPLKWAGGKRWLAPHIAPLWEKHQNRLFIEPFAGGLAIALALKPRQAILGDANPHLINFYRCLSRGLVVGGIALRNDEDVFYRQREIFNTLISEGRANTKKAAALFYYLNRTGYNGLCRFNSSGLFNVPFGRYKKINYVRDFTVYKSAFRGWRFFCRDFAQGRPSPGSFIYADPPYDVQFTEYSSGGFGWNDQVRLAQWLAKHPGPVVASNQATDRILELYGRLGFDIKLFDAPRRISCTGNRTPAKEILALKGI